MPIRPLIGEANEVRLEAFPAVEYDNPPAERAERARREPERDRRENRCGDRELCSE